MKNSGYICITILWDMINEVMIENNMYYDNYRADAIETIYPLIAGIVFHPNFSHIRDDEKAIFELITYLVKRLS